MKPYKYVQANPRLLLLEKKYNEVPSEGWIVQKNYENRALRMLNSLPDYLKDMIRKEFK